MGLLSAGLLALDRGDSIGGGLLERALAICRAAELPVYVPRINAALGHAHVLLGRGDALPVLEHAVAEAERRRQRRSSLRPRAAGGRLPASGGAGAGGVGAERAVDLSRKRDERGTEARALRFQAEAYQRAGGSRGRRRGRT